MSIACCICKGVAEKIKTIIWCTQCGTIQIRSRSEERGYFLELRWPVNMNRKKKMMKCTKSLVAIIKAILEIFFNLIKRIKP